MDALTPLLHGFAIALTPLNLLWALVGVTLGTAVGVLPGIGPALTVAMLLPATGKHPTTHFRSAVTPSPIMRAVNKGNLTNCSKMENP